MQTHVCRCLNPFEFRAGLEPVDPFNRYAKAKVLIPLNSGLAWSCRSNRNHSARCAVLIPLNSGLAWSRWGVAHTCDVRLNPFEFRAGLELQGAKNAFPTSTCKGLYGFFRPNRRCLSAGGTRAWCQSACVGAFYLAAGLLYSAAPCQSGGRLLRTIPSGSVLCPSTSRRPRAGRG